MIYGIKTKEKIYQYSPQTDSFYDEKGKLFTPVNMQEHKKERPVSLILKFSDNCNFSCNYCFPNLHLKEKITPTPLDQIEKLVDAIVTQVPDLKHVVFFGGEPLLHFEDMKNFDVSIRKHIPSIRYATITNASLLTDEISDWLIEKNVEVKISHDGVSTKFHRNIDVLDNKNVVRCIRKLLKNLPGKVNFNITWSTHWMDWETIIQPIYDKIGRDLEHLIYFTHFVFAIPFTGELLDDSYILDAQEGWKQAQKNFHFIRNHIKILPEFAGMIGAPKGMEVTIGEKGCTALKETQTHCYINGDVYPCLNGPEYDGNRKLGSFLGNENIPLLRKQFREERLKMRHEFYDERQVCHDCLFRATCNRCFLSYIEPNASFCSQSYAYSMPRFLYKFWLVTGEEPEEIFAIKYE